MGPPSVSSRRPRLIVQCFPAPEAPPPAARSGQHCTWVHLQEEKHLLQVRGTWAEGDENQWPVECSGMVPIGMVPSLDSNSTPTAAVVTASLSSSSNTHSTDVAFEFRESIPVALASAITTTTFAPTPAPLSLSTTALAPPPAYSFPYSLPGFPSSLTDGLSHGHPPSLPPSGDLAESALPELSDEHLALYSPRTQAPMLQEANRVGAGTASEEEPAAQASEQMPLTLASTSASWYAGPPGSGWVNQQLVAEDTSSWLPAVSPVVQYAPQYLPAVSHCGTSSWCLSTAAASVPATSPSNALLLREMFYTHALGLGLTRRPGNGAKLDTCCSRRPATLSWPLQYDPGGPGGSPKLAPPKTLVSLPLAVAPGDVLFHAQAPE